MSVVTPFVVDGAQYVVDSEVCNNEDNVIELPDGRYFRAISSFDSFPPRITMVELTEWHEGLNVFEATCIGRMSYFSYGTRTYVVSIPESVDYFDGTLIRLPDGTMVVWGSSHDNMTPAMEDVVHDNDPRVASAGDHIYHAVEYTG